jgi:hypothetical protein
MTRSRRSLAIAFLCCGVVASGAAQQPIPAPLLKPFADNHDWGLFSDLDYRVGDSDVTITVPKGFVTDFASIPQAFWSAGLSPNGKYSKAAIVHDYLYWTQGCTRKQADNILMIAMKESGVDVATRTAIYEGVRLGGDAAWESNASERTKQLPRIVPAADLDFGPMVLWPDYRQVLAQTGVSDPPVASGPAYCAVGDGTDVPGRTN